MARVCKEIQEWVEETIEQPIEAWENRPTQHSFVRILVKVLRIVLVTVGKWIIRIVCEAVSIVLDALAWVALLILSIPILGGIIRTILNWLTEIVWRILGLPDFLLSLLGLRITKKIYVGAVVPAIDGGRVATDDQVMRQIDGLTKLYKDKCNVTVIFTGICHTDVPPPDSVLDPSCNAAGFFNDWWVAGSFFEFTSSTCRFKDAFRRIAGFGAEFLVFAVREIAEARGCSFGSSHNYVLVECRAEHPPFVTAHEIGHSCWLAHRDDASNLMHSPSPEADPQLTNWQVALIRWSKHCVYL